MSRVYNPYLPLNEYIPDGEPHVFGDRIYIYGSHDKTKGTQYCQQHYQVWSAPLDDLTDWSTNGVSYLRTQDPSNADDSLQLWAPDCVQGADGRYYLYYCFSFYPEIGVAVSDRPDGPFEFYGHVHYSEDILGGKTVQEGMVFDPAVLRDDDGRVWLYYGFAPAEEKEMHRPESVEELKDLPDDMRKKVEGLLGLQFSESSMVVELMPDMVTAKSLPKEMIPGGHVTAGTGFEEHGFFEASSIRKIRGKYYFVYSSHKSHELCYAVSDRPDGGYVYGGTIISNGDIGFNGREIPDYPLSNNHGGLVEIGDKLYIFYHRATDGTEFSRQGCAEEVKMAPDGSIPQVRKTSCGLNGGPLPASGIYPAGIACHLTDPTVINKIDYQDPVMKTQIRITEEKNDIYITGIRDGSAVGYRSFEFAAPAKIGLELRGDFSGTVAVSLDEAENEPVCVCAVSEPGAEWRLIRLEISEVLPAGEHAVYFRFEGSGECEMRSLVFEN